MDQTSKIYGCPVEVSLDRIGGKWKTLILARLKQGPMRYGDLRRAMPRLSDKVLTERLKALEAHDLVQRTSGRSGAVTYALTPRGESLKPVLEALYAWGQATAAALDLPVGDGREGRPPAA